MDMKKGTNQVAVNWKDNEAVNLSNTSQPPNCEWPHDWDLPYAFGACAGDLWIDFGPGNENKWEDEYGVLHEISSPANNSFRFTSDTLDLAAEEGGAGVNGSMTLTGITTRDGELPPLSASSEEYWVTASVEGSGNGQSINVSASTAALSAGMHYGSVRVTGQDCSPKSFVVGLRVDGDPVPVELSVSPLTGAVAPGGTLAFSVTASDQFGEPFSGTPMWSVDGGGSIDQDGLFSSDGTIGRFSVTVHLQGYDLPMGTATVTVSGVEADTGYVKTMLILTDGESSEYLSNDDAPGISDAIFSDNAALPGEDSTVNVNGSGYMWIAGQSEDGMWANEGNRDEFSAFGAVWVVSSTSRQVKLAYRHDDDFTAWCNGGIVAERSGWDGNTEIISPPFELNRGDNLLVFRVTEIVGGNHFAVRLLDGGGVPASGLTYNLHPTQQSTTARPAVADVPTANPVKVVCNPEYIAFWARGGGPYSARVYDASGARRLSVSGFNASLGSAHTIPLSRLGSGMYLLRLRVGTHQTMKRFVVQR
ncbi:MAG: T9SS type A sorting domain-containing protein [Chitinivibrionales bacterium]|nr:T9SS type A sorting domain-containing protein [Chitinivibrionales bacterium]MBD3359047.1 T9SS type A sorting domain-containing protein [Chitinivibrionales bacterium]